MHHILSELVEFEFYTGYDENISATYIHWDMVQISEQ